MNESARQGPVSKPSHGAGPAKLKCPRRGAGGGTASLHADKEFVAASLSESKCMKFLEVDLQTLSSESHAQPFILER